MALVNTGSWYQILLRRKTSDHYIPFPPIENFRVTSDILNLHIGLGVEHIEDFRKVSFSVTSLEQALSMVMAVENTVDMSRFLFSVSNLDSQPRMVLSVENS